MLVSYSNPSLSPKPFALLSILAPFKDAFDATLSCALPPHSCHNLTFKTTVDLMKIDAPMYPLSKLEDKLPTGFCQETRWVPLAVLDYTLLNNVTALDCYPLLLEASIAQSIAKSCFFLKLDLVNAFNQVCVAEGDK
ncbi:hypothetical protein DSO57_1019270 [Entomophthora muscae]|uniref:Uncharacterized protein n=1 Tax=Entomophthora muscae TaxID=34485 RepID=A0ACC2RIR1_9FUNG|nr:hypothetical protein DSO57_1019270 [Entomophthora muscae]